MTTSRFWGLFRMFLDTGHLIQYKQQALSDNVQQSLCGIDYRIH